MAQHLGGDGFDITANDIGSLIDTYSDPLTDQNLDWITKSTIEDEKVDENESEDKGMSLSGLPPFLQHMKEANNIACPRNRKWTGTSSLVMLVLSPTNYSSTPTRYSSTSFDHYVSQAGEEDY